jgi:class 3 adenylate cyclase
VALLNDYYEIIVEIILSNEGTINKFIGDSIMAIYGAPSYIDYPELRGVVTAVTIQKAIGEFNWQRMQEGKPVVNFGIGVHSGEAIAGNIGSARRVEYTVIGRDVNLAQRIEAATREGQVLVSETTYKKVVGLVEVQSKEPVFMKGILEPIPLYEVTGMKTSSFEEAVSWIEAAAGSKS